MTIKAKDRPPGKHLYRLVQETGSASIPAVLHDAWHTLAGLPCKKTKYAVVRCPLSDQSDSSDLSDQSDQSDHI